MKSQEFIAEGVDRSPEDVQKNHPEIYNFVNKITGPYSLEAAKVSSFDMLDKHHVIIDMGPTAGLNNTRAGLKSKGIGFDNRSESELIGEHGDLRFVIREKIIGPGNRRQTWDFEMPKAIEEDRGDGREYGIFYSKPRAEAQNNPATHAPVDSKVYPSKDHAMAAAQRWNKEKAHKARVRLVTPIAKAMIVAKEYNEKNYNEGGSHVQVNSPNQVTVTSLDDFEDMFIGTPEEFANWAQSKKEGLGEGETKWVYKCINKGHETPYEGPGAPEFTVRPCPICGSKAMAKKVEQVEEASIDASGDTVPDDFDLTNHYSKEKGVNADGAKLNDPKNPGASYQPEVKFFVHWYPEGQGGANREEVTKIRSLDEVTPQMMRKLLSVDDRRGRSLPRNLVQQAVERNNKPEQPDPQQAELPFEAFRESELAETGDIDALKNEYFTLRNSPAYDYKLGRERADSLYKQIRAIDPLYGVQKPSGTSYEADKNRKEKEDAKDVMAKMRDLMRGDD